MSISRLSLLDRFQSVHIHLLALPPGDLTLDHVHQPAGQSATSRERVVDAAVRTDFIDTAAIIVIITVIITIISVTILLLSILSFSFFFSSPAEAPCGGGRVRPHYREGVWLIVDD